MPSINENDRTINLSGRFALCLSYGFALYVCTFFLYKENHCLRQSALQKAVRLSLASRISTRTPQFRQQKLCCTGWDSTFLECFQYSRSQWGEQNFLRLSATWVTTTCLPQRMQRKERSVFPLLAR